MWLLKDKHGGITYLTPGKTMIVGRKQGDVILANDESISRRHASITVKPKAEWKMNEPTSLCCVQDIGSKYGSFVKDGTEHKKITTEAFPLSHASEIRFGRQQNIFVVEYIPIIVTSSTLDDDQKQELQNIMDAMDGWVLPDWKDYCTHLTVSNVTLTEKVVCALAAGVPIVNLDYWRAVLRAIKNNGNLPDPSSFVPVLNERLLNKENYSLDVNGMRKTLFDNLIFVCFSAQQYKLNSRMIKAAGGKPLLYERKRLQLKDLVLDNVILLQFSSDSTQLVNTPRVTYESIQDHLQENGRRFVPETEISLAILHCSIERYCNPKFHFKQLVDVPMRESVLKDSTVLALDTQDDDPPKKSKPPPIVIDETLESQMMQTDSSDFAKSHTGKNDVYIADTTVCASEFGSFPRRSKAAGKNIVIDETIGDLESSDKSIRTVSIQQRDRNVVGDPEIVKDGKKRGRFELMGEPSTLLKKPHFRAEKENVESAGTEIRHRKKTPVILLADSDSDDAGNFFEKPIRSNTEKKSTKTVLDTEESVKRAKRIVDSDSEESLQLPSTSRGPPKKQQKLSEWVARATNAGSVTNRRKSTKSVPVDGDDWIGQVPVTNNRSLNSSVSLPRRESIADESKEEENLNPFVYNQNKMKEKEDMWAYVKDSDAASDSSDDCFEIKEVVGRKKKKQTEEIVKDQDTRTNVFAKAEVEKQRRRKRSRSSSGERSMDEADNRAVIEDFGSIKITDEFDDSDIINVKANTSDFLNCTSTVKLLIRKDIKIDLNDTVTRSKSFIKDYNSIPKRRIKREDMYVWGSTMTAFETREKPYSSEDEEHCGAGSEDNFSHANPFAIGKQSSTTPRRRVRV